MERTTTRTPGDRLGHHELVRLLGIGGTGEVWEAVLHGPGGFRKPVAVKVLRRGPIDAGGRAALAREARLGALVQHPNVVGTHGVGEHHGAWHVTLELVRGASVAELVKHRPLPPAVVIDIGAQAAAGLACVHELAADGIPAGLVHRDVKPANLLVDRSGLVKLADLGISIWRGETAGAAGTPGYMAPEQADGRPEPRSDLFALGAVLYLLATGRRPFGTGAEALEPHLYADERVGSERFLGPVEAAVPGLAELIGACLRIDPARRPATARALAERLSALRSRQPAGPTLLHLLAQARPELGIDGTASAAEVPTRILTTGNLRPLRDRFVGRADELARIEALVRGGRERLLILLGPGGMGKTRLSLEAASRLQRAVAGGAWAFDLTGARSEDGICAALAAGLSLKLDRTDAVGQIGRVLAARGRALFLFDNLEQCVDHLPATLGRWVEASPEATFLCTSRVDPRLRGEQAVHLGELAIDDAVALLVARSPRPVRADEMAEARALCQAVDRMPLAIELAAARLRVLAVADVRARLGLALLSGGGRELPERHRSLTASLEWSWELLRPVARAALAQLSVLEGGFTLEAAEAVLDLRAFPGSDWALDVLQELVEASLLRVDAQAGRFSMLARVRDFASPKAAAAERGGAEARHGLHFARHGSPEVLAALYGPGALERRRTLELDLDNLLVACRRAVARLDGSVAVAALRAVVEVLDLRGPAGAGVGLALETSRMPGLAGPERANAAAMAARALVLSGNPDGGRGQYELALQLHRAAGDARSEGIVLGELGELHREQGRAAEAQAHYEEALGLHRQVGDRRSEGRALAWLGTLHHEQGRIEAARSSFAEALALALAVGDQRSEVTALEKLGALDGILSRSDEARTYLDRALALARELGDRRSEAIVLGHFANLEVSLGAVELAVTYYEQALALDREVGARRHEGISLTNVGILHMQQGRHDESLAEFTCALAIFREVGDHRSECSVLGAIGALHLHQGRLDEARGYSEQALAWHERLGHRRSVAIVLGNLAQLNHQLGRYAEAREQFARAIVGLREVADRRNEGMAHGELGAMLLEQDGPDEARPHLEQAMALMAEIGDRHGEAVVLHQMARLVLRSGGGVQAAEVLLDRGEVGLREFGDPAELALLLAARAEVAWTGGDVARARTALSEAEVSSAAGQPRVARELTRVRALVGG